MTLHKAERGGPPHPAVYPDAVIAVLADLLEGYGRVLDPFAGTGRIHELVARGFDTVGIEIEPEWVGMHERTHVGNALAPSFPDKSFDAIATSPTYGKRFADSYNAADPQARRSYRFGLGRKPHKDNSGVLCWGAAYRTFHGRAWQEDDRVLRPGGLFVLDIKDHIPDQRYVDVTGWHVGVLTDLGLRVRAIRGLPRPGFPLGANADRRAPVEHVIALEKRT
jgi:tRNA G10  N-methylase Trm11